MFTAAVVGGLGSLLGAALGSLYLKGAQWWLPGAEWQTLASAAGVLLVLMIIPGGIGDLVYRGRDAALRWVADAAGDRRAQPGGRHPPAEVVSGAEAAAEVEAVTAADDIVAIDIGRERANGHAGFAAKPVGSSGAQS